MAKWVSSNVLDSGLSYIQNNATVMAVISSYTAGASNATVSANICASVAMTGSDFTITTNALSGRVLTTASGKSATASANSGATPNLHIAFLDSLGNVLWVTDEASDQVITAGNAVYFPQLYITSSQPV